MPAGAPQAAPKVPGRPGLELGHPDQSRARQAAGTRTPVSGSPGWGAGPPGPLAPKATRGGGYL